MYLPAPTSSKHGFSLVELSIVLVILGLLVGGILAGQSLLRAAELRSVGREYQNYTTAVASFRDKYFALPGDMTNATSFWGTAAACPSLPATAAAGVCDGDGNGQIASNATNSNEVFGFWEHLAYAGLIEGSYSGKPNSGIASNIYLVIGTQIPSSKLSKAGWMMNYLAPVTAAASVVYFEGNYGNVFTFGRSNSGVQPSDPALRPEEAWNIDTKFDDGKPATGNFVTMESQGGVGTTYCSDLAPATSSLSASNYALGNTDLYCSFLIRSGY